MIYTLTQQETEPSNVNNVNNDNSDFHAQHCAYIDSIALQ